MERIIRSIQWKEPEEASATDVTTTDVTNAMEEGVVSATPHPDPDVDEPKGYSIQLTLKPDSSGFADILQDALMTLESPRITLRIEGTDDTISDVPVGVTKVPHLGVQNEAELSVKPEAHDEFHEYF